MDITKDMIKDIDVIFKGFADTIAGGWARLPDPEKQRILLQWAIHVLSISNFNIPSNEEDSISLAKQLIQLRKY